MNESKTKAVIKKEKIVEAALSIIKKKGLSGVTMEEIGAEMKLTKGSLYYYFKNKADLIYECHRHVLSKGMEEFESISAKHQDIFVILKKMVDSHLDNAINEKEAFNLLMSPKDFFAGEQLHAIYELRNRYESYFTAIFERGAEEGVFKTKDLVIARLFIMGGLNWIQQWYNPEGRLTIDEIKDFYYEYILMILRG